MKYRITAPNASYVGSISGVNFANGVAEVDGSVPSVRQVIAYCRGAGYTVEEIEPPEPEPTSKSPETGDQDNPPARPPVSASRAEWIRAAVNAGLIKPEEVDSKTTKEKLIELFDKREAEGGQSS
ncbi:MAG: hypothetical protein ACRDTG_28520 [Pseudonocardiaceae bacterium]